MDREFSGHAKHGARLRRHFRGFYGANCDSVRLQASKKANPLVNGRPGKVAQFSMRAGRIISFAFVCPSPSEAYSPEEESSSCRSQTVAATF